MRPLARLVTALAAGTLAVTLAPSAAQAKPAINLTPGSLTRGADVAIPHLDGKTVIDGAVRVKIKAPTVRLLGKSGADYIVATANREGGNGKIFRVAAGGTMTRLAKANVWNSELSDDGAKVVAVKVRRSLKSEVTVFDATTGAALAKRSFNDYTSILDADGDQVLLSVGYKTILWTTGTDKTRVVARRYGFRGDLSADILAVFNKDPYAGGCTVVTRISDGERLWKSCTEAVIVINEDGTRFATTDIMSDGLGPNQVDVRSATGKHLGRYKVKKGWFGEIQFETPTALLLEVNGPRKAFTARCDGTDCERASNLRKAEML